MSVKRQAEFASRKRKVGEPMVLPATVVGGDLGIFHTDFTLWNPEMTASRTLTALVDTGASYVQVPASILEELGIRQANGPGDLDWPMVQDVNYHGLGSHRAGRRSGSCPHRLWRRGK